MWLVQELPRQEELDREMPGWEELGRKPARVELVQELPRQEAPGLKGRLGWNLARVELVQ